MNQLNLRIELSDGTVLDVLSSASDLVKWEAHFNLGIDPAMRLNGLAVCVIDDKKVYFGRYKNLAAWIMDSLTWERDCAIVVEEATGPNGFP